MTINTELRYSYSPVTDPGLWIVNQEDEEEMHEDDEDEYEDDSDSGEEFGEDGAAEDTEAEDDTE